MTDADRDPSPAGASVAGRVTRWLASRQRAVVGVVAVVVVLVVGGLIVLRQGSRVSIAGSPVLPATYRPGIGIGPVSLGETPAAVRAELGGRGRQPVPGTLVYDRAGGQLAVGFAGGRAISVLATGRGNPFGQRLAAEETTLSSWDVKVCEKPAHVLLAAPGGHTYFVFPNATAGLGAVGVSTRPVTSCGPLG
jgi:hypothetical protein